MNKTNLNPLDRNLIDRPGRIDRLARFFTDYRVIVLSRFQVFIQFYACSL